MTQLVSDIERARERFLASLATIGAERAALPIGAGRWSPREYTEHLVRAEEATWWRMFTAVEDWRDRGERITSPTPDATIEIVVERTWRETEDAPPLAVPQFGGALSYWTARMRATATIAQTFASTVREDELDLLSYPHPISGPFTLRQGFGFVRFHLDRHRGQIEQAGRTAS